MKEEANIDKTDVEDLKLIAMVANEIGNIVFVTNAALDLSSAQVLEKFNSRKGSGFEEMASLEFVEKSNLAAHLTGLGGYKALLVDMVGEL